jgi:hypothetical protein
MGSGAGYLRTPFGVRFFEMERPLVARPKAAPSAPERFDSASSGDAVQTKQ